jgi:hypothetical protein
MINTRVSIRKSKSADIMQRLFATQSQKIFELQRNKVATKKKTTLINARVIELKIEKKKFELKSLRKIELIKNISTTISTDDDETNEISLEIKFLDIRFARLSQNEIVKIFLNKFKLINLYRLCHMKKLQFESYQDLNRVRIESEVLKLKKTFETYKNFEKIIHEI